MKINEILKELAPIKQPSQHGQVTKPQGPTGTTKPVGPGSAQGGPAAGDKIQGVAAPQGGVIIGKKGADLEIQADDGTVQIIKPQDLEVGAMVQHKTDPSGIPQDAEFVKQKRNARGEEVAVLRMKKNGRPQEIEIPMDALTQEGGI